MSSVYLETICYKKIALYCPRLDLLLCKPTFDIPQYLPSKNIKLKYEDKYYAKMFKYPETYEIIYSLWKMWLFVNNLEINKCRKQFRHICETLKKNPPLITMLPDAIIRCIDVCRRLDIHNNQKFPTQPIYITKKHTFKCSVCTKEVTGDVCLFRRCKCSDYIIHENCNFKTCAICDEKIHKY